MKHQEILSKSLFLNPEAQHRLPPENSYQINTGIGLDSWTYAIF